MPAAFLDSSALVKLVRSEPETAALRRFLTRPRHVMLVSEPALTDVRRAARRVGVDPEAVLAECDVVLLRSEHLEHAAELEPATIRTLDAVHLATALSVADRLDAFVVYDDRLATAAEAHSLPVAAPT